MPNSSINDTLAPLMTQRLPSSSVLSTTFFVSPTVVDVPVTLRAELTIWKTFILVFNPTDVDFK